MSLVKPLSVAVVLCFGAQAVQAATVTVDIVAQVASVSGPATVGAVGDTMTAVLTFDDATPGVNIPGPPETFFVGGVTLAATLNGVVFDGTATPAVSRITMLDDCLADCTPADLLSDGFEATVGQSSSVDIETVELFFEDNRTDVGVVPTMLTGESLSDLVAAINSGALLGQSNSQGLNVRANGLGANCVSTGLGSRSRSTTEPCEVRATVTSMSIRAPGVVPLPAGLPLMLAGLAGLAMLRRRAR